jgi:murein DD-endopeptidase MepM/ murein hydrolase activator NlpD
LWQNNPCEDAPAKREFDTLTLPQRGHLHVIFSIRFSTCEIQAKSGKMHKTSSNHINRFHNQTGAACGTSLRWFVSEKNSIRTCYSVFILLFIIFVVGGFTHFTVVQLVRSAEQKVIFPASIAAPETMASPVPLLKSMAISTTKEVVPSLQGQPEIYTVEPGDTLYEIALAYGVNLDDLIAANNIDDPDVIQVGQQLVIPVIGLLQPLATPLTETPMPAIRAAPTPVGTSHQQDMNRGSVFACEANTTVRPLILPADPIRLILTDRWAYFIADGDLYGVPRQELIGHGYLGLRNLMPEQRQIGRYVIQELAYAAGDVTSGDLLLLDKTNDVYRYDVSGEWSTAFPAAPIPGQFPDPQFLAVQPVKGNIYALDSDLSHIWALTPGAATPVSQTYSDYLSTGVDMAVMRNAGGTNTYVVLTRDGELLGFQNKSFIGAITDFKHPEEAVWPAQVFAADESVYVVDGEARSVTRIDPASGTHVWQATFHFPNMQRLRGAAIADNILYGLAGRNLYLADLSTLGGSCPPVVYDNTFYFGGMDVSAAMPGFVLPFPNAVLPTRPRSYPGARRLYRYGIHKGVDLYITEAAGLGVGSPVRAIADGVVVRADQVFQEMSPEEYEAAIAHAKVIHYTPLESADALLGRQVRVDHGLGVQSWYAHLSAVPTGLRPGIPIDQHAVLGNVGVSGTSAGAYGTQDGAHLHLEIWINDRYLGQGLSLYETWRLWLAVFDRPVQPGQPADVTNAELEPRPQTPEPLMMPSPTPTSSAASADAPPAPRACQQPPDEYARTTDQCRDRQRTYPMDATIGR